MENASPEALRSLHDAFGLIVVLGMLFLVPVAYGLSCGVVEIVRKIKGE